MLMPKYIKVLFMGANHVQDVSYVFMIIADG